MDPEYYHFEAWSSIEYKAYKKLYNDSAVPVAQSLWDFRLQGIMWLDDNIKATNLSKQVLYDIAVHNSICFVM